MMSVQSSLVMYPIYAYGAEDSAEKYLPKLATRRLDRLFRPHRGGGGLGSRSMKTRAETIDGGYRLTGSKMWIIQCADRRRLRGLGEILGPWRADPRPVLEKGMKGLSAPKIEGKLSFARLGHRRDRDGRRRCSRRQLLPNAPASRAVRLPQPRALRHRLGVMGAAEDCWRRSRDYAMERKQFGRPLRGDPAGPEEARRHADRDRARPAGVAAASAA